MKTEQFVLDAVREFLEPLTQRSVFRASRLAVLKDGSTMPVLEMLARRKFPTGWDQEQFPFWLDGDRQNEMLGNVGLATRAAASPRQRSAFGVPAGTKEYMRLWRAAHRDQVRASQQRFAQRRRAVLQAAREAIEAQTPADAELHSDPVLEKLFAAVHGTSQKTE